MYSVASEIFHLSISIRRLVHHFTSLSINAARKMYAKMAGKHNKLQQQNKMQPLWILRNAQFHTLSALYDNCAHSKWGKNRKMMLLIWLLYVNGSIFFVRLCSSSFFLKSTTRLIFTSVQVHFGIWGFNFNIFVAVFFEAVGEKKMRALNWHKQIKQKRYFVFSNDRSFSRL